MHPPSHHCTSKGCGLASFQPHVGLPAANFSPISRTGLDISAKESGFNLHPCSHRNAPSSPPCYTQLIIVTCCCFIKQHIVCEGTQSLNVLSPTTTHSKDKSHLPELRRDFHCPAFAPQSSLAGETVLPPWSSGCHICVHTGTYKDCCCIRSRLGKRIYLAARRLLAGFGLRRSHNFHLRSTSPAEYPSSVADSSMSWELPKSYNARPPRDLPAGISCEKEISQHPAELTDSQLPASMLSPPVTPCRPPAPCQYGQQPAIPKLNTFFPGHGCHQRSASELEDTSLGGISLKGTSPAGVLEGNSSKAVTNETKLGHGAGDADQSQSLSNDSAHGLPSEDTAEFGNFSSLQASCASNGNTPASIVDLHSDNQSEDWTTDLQLCSLSDQDSVPSESNKCDCLCLQSPNLDRCLSPPELLAILESQSGKLEGLTPSGLLERMESVFKFTTEQSLRKLVDLEDINFHDVVNSASRVKPTLAAGFSALKSLVAGHVPDGLNEIMSLLFVASSIWIMLVGEQNQAGFVKASFLDAIELGNAIKCRTEQDAFKMLLHFVWLPTTLNPICPHGYRWSSRVDTSPRPTPGPFEPTATQFEDRRLDKESERSCRLRYGANVRICQWYTECRCTICPCLSTVLT
jgi:hypothetical protein